MTGHWFNFPEDHTADTSHIKDSRLKAVMVGLVFPAAILAVVIANLVSGWVVLPNDRPVRAWLVLFPYGGIFAGIVAIKLGFAVALFGWYWLANVPRLEHAALPTLASGIGLIVVGLTVVVVAALW